MPARKFVITVEMRGDVKTLAGIGLTRREICSMIGLRSTKTLTKYFRNELEIGSVEALAHVKRTQFRLASSGKHPWSTKRWLERHAKWSTDPNTGREGDPEPVDVTFAIREYQPRIPDEDVRRKLLAFGERPEASEWEGDSPENDDD